MKTIRIGRHQHLGIMGLVMATAILCGAQVANLVDVKMPEDYEDYEVEVTLPRYAAQIDSADQVYDGDTLQDVIVKLPFPDMEDGEIWPGVFKAGDMVLVKFDLRIAGIDTPEKRPKKAGRTEESLKAEKKAAGEARLALVGLLKESKNQFEVLNPKTGKYAGRMVGNLIIDGVDVGQVMIELGHAKPYDGGTKPEWGF